jgi:hypothetical protein
VQNAALELIGSLVGEGLFEPGYRSDEDDRFVASDEPLDESMRKIYDAYVTHNDDGLRRAYHFWLNLTDKGSQLVLSTEKGRRIAQAVEEELREIWEIKNLGRA